MHVAPRNEHQLSREMERERERRGWGDQLSTPSSVQRTVRSSEWKSSEACVMPTGALGLAFSFLGSCCLGAFSFFSFFLSPCPPCNSAYFLAVCNNTHNNQWLPCIIWFYTHQQPMPCNSVLILAVWIHTQQSVTMQCFSHENCFAKRQCQNPHSGPVPPPM